MARLLWLDGWDRGRVFFVVMIERLPLTQVGAPFLPFGLALLKTSLFSDSFFTAFEHRISPRVPSF